MKLIATLEDDDDVQNVYGNYDLDEATLNQLSAA
ncbi:MAG TPA: YebC/PmpR family DNA-binding transcriptional regulator, partial [Propylenella sp.]|nr:YebC/PmpR family DNA-binding transcriptional regulator [Propylenella sp.]